jgi:Fic family protein
MKSLEIEDSAPGRLVSLGRESYYRPDPLPPSRDLAVDGDVYDLLADATFWLGKLSGVTLELDFPPVLYTSLLRKEAMESAEIEGADVDYNALYSLETRSLDEDADEYSIEAISGDDDTKDTQEVLNYEQAIEDGIDALDRGNKISVTLLHDLHEVLLTDVPDDCIDTDTIGDFKATPNHLGDFLPPVLSEVDGLMDALMTYYRTGGSYHTLIDIALFHYQFETIHPYGDGNGRLGRLLITLQLYDTGLLERPNLYLSEYFNRNKTTYVDRMGTVRANGDWEGWLSFFLKGVAQQAEESVTRTLALDELRCRYEDEYGGAQYAKNRLACKLFERPYVTTKTVADMLGIERSTAYRAIDTLENEGVLEEVTGKQRNKEYRAKEVFDILERPPQTF